MSWFGGGNKKETGRVHTWNTTELVKGIIISIASPNPSHSMLMGAQTDAIGFVQHRRGRLCWSAGAVRGRTIERCEDVELIRVGLRVMLICTKYACISVC